MRDVCGKDNHFLVYDHTEVDGEVVLTCAIPKCEVEERYQP